MPKLHEHKVKVKKDIVVIEPHRPKITEKVFFLISGIIVSVPMTLLFGTLTSNFLGNISVIFANILSIIIFTPFIEEFAKAFPLFYRHGETQRSIFILGFLVGLGFGISEFFLYIFVFDVPFPLRLPGILFHASSTSIVAYGIAKKNPLAFYLVAVGLHFLNNFSAIFELGSLGIIVANLGAYYLSWRFYNETSERFIDENLNEFI
ncbi:MAG: PrsW family glutamic-type intramembrane protease [Methanobacterium sp.]|nr:PrsW family glutamic-type intramembrane protease [Methanobacterium sp.]